MTKSPDGQAPQTYRLTDMLVEEVSLVDRPANQQRFVTIKRETDMNKCPKCDTAIAADATKCAKCGATVTAKSADEVRTERRKSLAMSPDARTKAVAFLQKAAAELTELAKDIADAPASDAAPGPALVGEVMKAVDQLAEIDGMTPALVAKGTSTASAVRIARVKSAVDVLSALHAEMTADPKAADEIARAEAAKADLAKRDSEIATAQKRAEEVAAELKKSQDELAALKAARPAGNAMPVEQAPPAAVAKDEGWSRDLNSPHDKKSTKPDQWLGK